LRFTFYAVTPWDVNFTRVFTLSCYLVEVQITWAKYRISCTTVTVPFAVNGGEFRFTFYAVTSWDINFAWVFTRSCSWIEVQAAMAHYRISCTTVTVPFAVNPG
jgi:hypothetical protein